MILLIRSTVKMTHNYKQDNTNKSHYRNSVSSRQGTQKKVVHSFFIIHASMASLQQICFKYNKFLV